MSCQELRWTWAILIKSNLTLICLILLLNSYAGISNLYKSMVVYWTLTYPNNKMLPMQRRQQKKSWEQIYYKRVVVDWTLTCSKSKVFPMRRRQQKSWEQSGVPYCVLTRVWANVLQLHCLSTSNWFFSLLFNKFILRPKTRKYKIYITVCCPTIMNLYNDWKKPWETKISSFASFLL